jgi:hypothetical protein
MAMLATKFDLGDTVWKISGDREEIKLPCRFCRGQGWLRVEGANEQSTQVKCPECGTNATVTLGTWPVWRVDYGSPLKIGQIQLRVYDRTGIDNGKRADNRNPASIGKMHETDEEGYMAWSTGVGSGTVHHAEDLFATKEEAEEEAALRTERARAGEDPGGRPDRWRKWWPDQEQVRVAAGFLDHRDVYEHDAAHVALAEAIVEVGAKKERERREART